MTTTGQHHAPQTLPEGVQCIACGYSLCGLTAERDCPECGAGVGDSIPPDIQALARLLWFHEQVNMWRAQSILLAVTAVLIPTIWGAAAFLFPYFFVYFHTVTTMISPPYVVRRHGVVMERWTAALLCAGPALIAIGLIVFPLLVVGSVMHAVSMVLLGNAIERAGVENVWIGKSWPLTRLDAVLALAIGLLSLAFGLAAISPRPVDTAGFFIVAVIMSALVILIGGIAHAVMLSNTLRHLSKLIANGRRTFYPNRKS